MTTIDAMRNRLRKLSELHGGSTPLVLQTGEDAFAHVIAADTMVYSPSERLEVSVDTEIPDDARKVVCLWAD